MRPMIVRLRRSLAQLGSIRKRTWLICALLWTPSLCAQQPRTGTSRPVRPAAIEQAAEPSIKKERPISAEQVRELLSLTGMGGLQKEAISQMMPALRAALPPYVPGDVLQDFENRMLGPKMQATVVQAYQAHLSASDATAAIAFYRSAAGQHFVAATPQITHDVQIGVQELAQREMLDVVKLHQAEINAAKLKYEAAHISTPPKT